MRVDNLCFHNYLSAIIDHGELIKTSTKTCHITIAQLAPEKKMDEIIYASSLAAQPSEPKPESPVFQRIRANAAKFQPGGERYHESAVTQTGDNHENESGLVNEMVSKEHGYDLISRTADIQSKEVDAEPLSDTAEEPSSDKEKDLKLSAAIRPEMESRIISKIEEKFSGKPPTPENIKKLEQLILANADAPFVAVVDKKVRCFVITRFAISISDSNGVGLPEYEGKGGGDFTPYAADTYQTSSTTHFIYSPVPLVPARVYDGHFAIEIRLDERKLDECSGYKGKT